MTASGVLAQIDAFRAEFHACTGGMLERHFGVPHRTMQHQLDRLYVEGWVDWSEVVGSVHVTAAGEAWLRGRRVAA